MVFPVRKRDTFDFLTSTAGVLADAAGVYAGFMLAMWIRFFSGWIPLHGESRPPMFQYLVGAAVATVLFILIFRAMDLYRRPQHGHFTEKMPRIVRGCAYGLVISTAMAFAVRNPPFSRVAMILSFFTVTLVVLIERNILFQCERHWARHQAAKKNVVICGIGPIAGQLTEILSREHRLRAKPVAYFSVGDEAADPRVPADLVRGPMNGIPDFLGANDVDEVIVANPSGLTHAQLVDLIIQCEKALADFQMVPDIFGVLTSRVDMQMVGGIPMLGVGKWPLDYFWNRARKRAEDIAGAIVGLIISAPIIAIAALVIRKTSPGPIFYRQERCGERGKVFNIYKLRTMHCDAESQTGPVWASPDDPRRTRFGTFLRKYNLDELPQFWNVLTGEMSLVGPRPERPHFVEQFKEDIARYMWRHVSKPGLTGWAQVNGLRGQTSIEDRISYDLFYLENWSLSLDFKILIRTLFSTKNAY